MTLRGELTELTPRELEVLEGYAMLADQHKVADSLGISIATVRTHLETIYAKLDVHSGLEAMVAVGWLRLPTAEENMADDIEARFDAVRAELTELLTESKAAAEHFAEQRPLSRRR